MRGYVLGLLALNLLTLIWGTTFDENLSDELRVTVVATGFENAPAQAAP